MRKLDLEIFSAWCLLFLFQTQLHIQECFGSFRGVTLSSMMLLSTLNSLSGWKGGVSRKCRTLNKSKSSTWTDSSLGCVNDSNHQLNLFISRGQQSWLLLLFHMENTEQKEKASGFAVPDSNSIGQCRFYREGVVLCIGIQFGLVLRNTYIFR